MLTVSQTWKNRYPDAHMGILAMTDVANPRIDPGLEQRKSALEEDLRARYGHLDRDDLRALPTFQAYRAYYKGFKKTYHLLLQFESIVFKGKSIPNVAALVEAMFMAELEDHLLTAGHDLAMVEPPVGIYVATGEETYTRINGVEQQLKADDMYVADAQGVLSSIIYGPDQRTQIRAETEQVLFTCYAPAGIHAEKVWDHLHNLEAKVKLISPEAKTEHIQVYDDEEFSP